ncbi:MAG TPA: MFS transporter [Acidimicrobiia bacterium]|nr:MFS transporter [Acidimicrobiia bacterium]
MSDTRSLELAADPEAHPRRWVILGVLCTSLLLVMQGNTALNLALPKIAESIGLSSSAMQWIVDVYSLVFAGLLFTTSTVGDRFGRKGVMQAGLALFGLASGYAAFVAGSAGALIAARALMGLAGAMIMPSTLSILTNVFPAHERPKAIAVWAGIAGGGAALGMILNGFILEHFSWHSVFVLNLPLAVGALAVGAVIIPRSKDPNGGRIDLLGAVLSTAGVASLVYGLIEAPTHGWLSGETLAFLAAGLTALGLFVAWQLRTAEPMLDVRLFRKPAFGVSSLTLTMVFFALMGIFFSISQLFQLVMGYGTFESALRSSPIFVAMILVAPQAPTIAKRIGTRRTVAGGLVLVAAGIGILSQLADVPSYAQVAGGMVVMAVGMALAMSPTTGLLMSAVPRNRAGMGSAMNDTTRELGGSLGIAVLGSVMASNYAAHVAKAVVGMPAQAAAAVKSSLAGGLTVAAQTGNGTLAATAKSAFMSGLTLSMVVGAVIILAAAALAFFGLPADEPAFVEPALDGDIVPAVAA